MCALLPLQTAPPRSILILIHELKPKDLKVWVFLIWKVFICLTKYKYELKSCRFQYLLYQPGENALLDWVMLPLHIEKVNENTDLHLF